jgi:hypothetical protein
MSVELQAAIDLVTERWAYFEVVKGSDSEVRDELYKAYLIAQQDATRAAHLEIHSAASQQAWDALQARKRAELEELAVGVAPDAPPRPDKPQL